MPTRLSRAPGPAALLLLGRGPRQCRRPLHKWHNGMPPPPRHCCCRRCGFANATKPLLCLYVFCASLLRRDVLLHYYGTDGRGGLLNNDTRVH